MHRSTRRKLDKIGLASAAVGAVVLVAFGLSTLRGGDSDGDPSADSTEAFVPYETEVLPEEPTITPSTPASGKSPALLTDALDSVGKFGKGGDNSVHKVVLTAKSDGGIYVGYRLRGGREGIQVAEKKFAYSNSARGPLPIAQLGVQILSTATYATCTISVDGVVVSTKTVRGTYRVLVCFG